jgi:hypothetical protein
MAHLAVPDTRQKVRVFLQILKNYPDVLERAILHRQVYVGVHSSGQDRNFSTVLGKFTRGYVIHHCMWVSRPFVPYRVLSLKREHRMRAFPNKMVNRIPMLEVSAAVTLNSAVSWDVRPCNLFDRLFYSEDEHNRFHWYFAIGTNLP